MIHMGVKFIGTIKNLPYSPFAIEEYNGSKKSNIGNKVIVQLYGVRDSIHVELR